MSRGISKKTKQLTVSSLLCAIGVALLFVGSVVETLDLSMAALASFLCVFAVIELSGKYSWMIYAATGLLSVILMPYSMGGWFYLLFFGYYPIIKEKLEKLKKPVEWLLKIITLNLALIICVFAAYFLFFGQTEGKSVFDAFTLVFGDSGVGEIMAIVIYALVNVVFVIYDIALTRLITLYFYKIRHRFKFLK